MKNITLTALAAVSILYVVVITAFVFACVFFIQASPLSIYWGIVESTPFEVIAPIYWIMAYIGALALSLNVINAD